ncbi:MAG: sensor histidine kinase [Lachnospiraceae bacterium]
MIKKLQRRFILIVMGSLFTVFVLLIGGINLVNVYKINKESNELLQLIADNDGNLPQINAAATGSNDLFGLHLSEETEYKTRFFTVVVTEDEEMETNLQHIAAVAEEEALIYASEVLSDGRSIGYIDTYKFMVTSTSDGNLMIIFLECGTDLRNISVVAWTTICAGMLVFCVVLALIFAFSRRAITPIIESMERQKQFITDAGHEIKTPLAIISANAEVLEMYSGKSEWTDSIRNQVERLNILVQNLLTLSKLEESGSKVHFIEVQLSQIIEESAASFEVIAQTKHCSYECSIQEGIIVHGDPEALRRLANLLLDNAVTYVNEDGAIKVVLKRTGKYVDFSVINTCTTPPKENLNRLFDRFYRADSSRARTSGGYGIGLSVAQATVREHQGKISAESKDGSIIFRCLLPIGNSNKKNEK